MCYRGLVPIKDLETWWPFKSYSISWLGPDKHFLAFPISKNKTLNIVAFVYSDDERALESWTATGHRSEVQKEFESFDPTVRKTISFMNEFPSKWILNDRELLDQWVFGSGKIVLMGDAAHAVSNWHIEDIIWTFLTIQRLNRCFHIRVRTHKTKEYATDFI